ncbi:MAG: alcohol dehydrogenase-like regulatory protein ErcA [Smithella sp.]
MGKLRKFVAPEFIFGEGARKLAGQYAGNLGARKVLLVTDPGIIAAGWLDDIIASLAEAGLPYTVFSAVTPNPKAEEVMTGAEIYKSEGCNTIVALGGGSPIDCAKGIAIVSTNHRHILSFEGVDKVEIPMPPLICIPTTAGTSADVSQFCIIMNKQDKAKISIVSKAVLPDAALIDPIVTTTMDPYLTACTGMDALTHGIEAFVSTGSFMVTDMHALEAIRIISKNLIEAVKKPDDIDLRSKIMHGSLEAGLAFSNAILGAVHAMAHSLGGLLDLPHGECNSVLLDHAMAFNFNAAAEKYKIIGEAMGLDFRGMNTGETKKAILSYVNNLRRSVGIHKTLSKMGVKTCDIPDLAQKAMKDVCIYTNPREATKRDIEVIYEEAL